VQARLSIGLSGLRFGSSRSRPLHGAFATEDALRRVLAGTDFTFDRLEGGAVRIRMRARMPAPPFRQGVETIIVTATKREETVQNLPYAISAVSGRQLEDFGIDSSHGLTLEAAGLTATNLGAGEDKLFVRGLTDSIVPGLSESVVGIYLDDARIVDDAPDPDLALIDIDRVEVLRGPQGSLYGAGSLTGLVRIVTNGPDFENLRGMVRMSGSETDGGGLSTAFDGMVNLPLVRDALALRVAGYDDSDAGYIDETRLGKSNTNRTNRKGGRAQLGWRASPRWTAIANVALQGTHAADSQYYLGTLGPDRRDNYVLEPHNDNFVQAGLTVKGALDRVGIVSNTSFVGRALDNRFDASFAWPSLTGYPLGPAPFDYHRKIQSFTHETRIASDSAGPWTWLAGVFLAHRDEDFSSRLQGPGTGGAIVLARSERREDRESEAAIFGEASVRFAPRWTFTAGLRAFDAIRKVSDDVGGSLVSPGAPFAGSNGQSGVAPKAILEYQPSDRLTFYAQAAEGYRLGDLSTAGGTIAGSGTKFDSDELWNYELGTKFDAFRHRLIWDAAIYYADWRNVQTDQIAPDGAFYVLDAGHVRDVGFETEFALRMINGVSLRGNFFWNNAVLSDRNPALATGEGVLPGAPDVTADISARDDFAIGHSGSGFASIDFSYVGVSHLGFAESTPSMGGYRLTNIRIGIARGSWQLALFGDNLTDDRGNTFAFGNPFDLARGPLVTPPRPRTFGITLSWTK
jgi:iron complex outermembrane receptor protein